MTHKLPPLRPDDESLLRKLFAPVEAEIERTEVRREIIRCWRGGLPYVVEWWPAEWERFDYRLLDWDGNEVGRCRKAGGVKEPLQSARRLLKTLHETGKLRARYHDDEEANP